MFLNGYLCARTEIHSLGCGEWSIEVFDEFDNFVKEFVGNNGTTNFWNPEGESDDLWAELEEWCNLENEDYNSYEEYVAKNGK